MPRRQTNIIVALTFLLACATLLLLAQGNRLLVQQMGGAFSYPPEDAEWVLSDAAKDLVKQAYQGFEKDSIVDHHVFALSRGQRGAGEADNPSSISPDLFTWRHPVDRLRSGAYLSAAGVSDISRFDDLYLARLTRLVRALPQQHRLSLAALDKSYDRDGASQPSSFYTANDYVWNTAHAYPRLFTPAVSVHPYRKDAVKALQRWAKRGVKTVYWLPNMQGIDPSDENLDDFYQALIDNHMTLLTHTGEQLFLGGGNADYGNPLRYRHALKMGVRIIMAHCAGDRLYPDPEHTDADARPGYEWFIQLATDSDYHENLYGDISGLTYRSRVPGALTAILQHPQIFDRLVYASDYPSPAVNRVIDIDALVDGGFIKAKQAPELRELYRVNPLLFDFVLTRSLRLPQTDLGFPVELFTREVGAK